MHLRALGEEAELAFGLEFGLAQALALAGDVKAASAAFAQLLDGPLGPADYGLVASTRLRLLQFENRQVEAVALGYTALARLGAPLPKRMNLPRAALASTRAWLQVRKLDLDRAMALPVCEDPRGAALVELVAQLKYPAFVVNNDLFVYLGGLHVLLLERYGFHETTPVALADLAVGISGGFDMPAEGVRLLGLARELCQRVERPEVARANILAIGCSLAWHRGRAFGDFLADYGPGYERALEAGEIDHAAFIGSFGVDMSLETGVHLAVLERRARKLEHDNGRRGAVQMEIVSITTSHLCCELLGERAPGADTGERRRLADFDSEAILARGGVDTNIDTARTNFILAQLVLGELALAVRESFVLIETVEKSLFNSWIVARACLVICASVWAKALEGGGSPPKAEAMARKSFKLIVRWAKACPENYGHYVELASGLRDASRGRYESALGHLDRAWSQAHDRGCRFVEGLAAEYCAHVLERQGKRVLVEGAWWRAWEAYASWGAEAKLARMRKLDPGLFNEADKRGRRGAGATTKTPLSSSSSSESHALDLEAILHGVGTITQDLALDEVITRVLETAQTHAGADHALLMLERGGELCLCARAEEAAGSELLARPSRLCELEGQIPTTVVHFVVRTGRALVLDEVAEDPRFANDTYLEREGVRSIVALPVVKEELLGVLVLENRLSAQAFTPAIIESLELIIAQAASTLDNARLHAALRGSEARWRSLVDGAPDLIALLDERGRLLFANRGELDAGGEVPFTSMMNPDSRERWDRAVQGVLTHGEAVELELELNEEQEGKCVSSWFAARIAPIELELEFEGQGLGRRRHAVVIATDISARKRAEAERALLEAQLRQQQRLESLGILASGVAHEINNPVQGIMSYAELITYHSDDPETVLEFAHEIAHETDRVAAIVRNLLHFSRQEHMQEFEQAKVSDLINGTISLIRAVLRKDQIVLELDIEDLAVTCRVQQVQQVIMNLVTNARDALNERYPDYDKRKRIKIRSGLGDHAQVRVTVEDQGGGIPEHVISHIFDPFFTTKGRDKGTGLGLAVSHGIAQEHGGELSVETVVGEGTCFHLDLPAR